MAGPGTYTAYSQLQPINQNFSDNLIDAEDVQLRNRLLKQQEQQAKAQEAKAWAQELGTSLSKIKQTAIGINSVDEMNARVLLKAKQHMREAYQKLKKDPTDVDAIVQIKNLEQLPENLMNYQQQYKGWVEGIRKGVAEGRFSPTLNQDLFSKIDRTIGQNNAYFDLGKDGSLIGIMVDPEMDGYEFKPIGEVLDGTGLEQPVLKADYRTAQKAIASMYQTHKTESLNGVQEITKTALRESDVQGIQNDTNRLWGDSAANMTDYAKSVLADGLGIDPNQVNEQMFQKYKQDFANEIVSSFKTEETVDPNFDVSLAYSREARLRDKEDKATGEKENYLRTQIDGALAGDPKYLENLKGIKLEEKGKEDKTIADTEFVNGKLIIQFSDGQIEEIDPKDKDKAVGQLLKLVRPAQKADERLGEYQAGKVLEEFTPGDTSGKSTIKVKSIIGSIKGTKAAEAVDKLTSRGIEGFTAESNFFSPDKIIGPDGTKYNPKSEADMKKLEKYLLGEEPAATAEPAQTSTGSKNPYGI